MALKPKVDEEKCVGCGACASICPDVFEMIDGKSKIKQNEDCQECDCQSVVSSCPTEAITLEEEK